MALNYLNYSEKIAENEKVIKSYIEEEYGDVDEFKARFEILNALAIHNSYDCRNIHDWENLLEIGQEIFDIAHKHNRYCL